MEGPSLYLAAERLSPFIGKTILKVEGNTRIGKERLLDLTVRDIFSWGKHLVFQFDDFAFRVHFMMFGSYQAIVNDKKVSGDYPRKKVAPRLALFFENGELILYSCSIRYIEHIHALDLYDYSIDAMSVDWDAKKALKAVRSYPEEEIADVLLDQTIFAGVGNIIKNEVLFLAKKLPSTKVSSFSSKALKEIVEETIKYTRQFYKWHKRFVLKKHYKIYRKSICPICQGKVTRKKTGKRNRVSFFCSHCQK